MSAKSEPTPSTSGGAAASCLSTDTLLSLLECPVCLEFCIPPIYACSIGHKICKGCSPNIHRCPVCRSGYMGTRDFVAEELYTKLSEAGLVPGLTTEDIDDDTEKEIECHLGKLSETLLMQCSLGALTTLPNFECYIAHLTHRHKVSKEALQLDITFRKRFYYRNMSFVRNGASKLLVLNCNERSFLLSLNKAEDVIWIYVVAATAKIANEFQIDLEIPSSTEDGLLASNLSKHVYCVKEKPEDIYKKHTCLTIKENLLNEHGCRRLAKTGRYWELMITIRRKENSKTNSPGAPPAEAAASPQRTIPLIAELPHFDDDGDGDDLGDQILGLQNQVRDFRIGLMNRIQSATRAERRRPPFGAATTFQLSPDETSWLPAGDGSIRNRALLYRSLGTSNLSADSTDTDTRGQIALRERSLGRLREHRDMVLELRRLREQREALERRDVRDRPRVLDRRALRRTPPASSVITSRDFFTDSDEENEYIERLAREHSSGGASQPGSPDSPFASAIRPQRRAVSATVRAGRTGESDYVGRDPVRSRYLNILAQQRRATSPDASPPTPTRSRDNSSTSPDSGCVIS